MLSWNEHGDEAPNRSEGCARSANAMSTCWRVHPSVSLSIMVSLSITGSRAHPEDAWKY